MKRNVLFLLFCLPHLFATVSFASDGYAPDNLNGLSIQVIDSKAGTFTIDFRGSGLNWSSSGSTSGTYTYAKTGPDAATLTATVQNSPYGYAGEVDVFHLKFTSFVTCTYEEIDYFRGKQNPHSGKMVFPNRSVPTITIVVNGNGTVTPNINGQSLAIGKNYKFTAKAATGYIFSGWSGSVVSVSPVITFKGQTNMSLQANFIPNPFIPTAGTYQGLFFNPANVAPDRAGRLTVTTTSSGSYSAKLALGIKTYSFSGQFSLSGHASTNVTVDKFSRLTLTMQVDMAGGNSISGTVGNGIWTANLSAFRSGRSRVPAGKYTLFIPGSDNSAQQPGGEGFGSLLVSSTGSAKWNGTLADGTVITPSANISREGKWPLHASLYSGKGVILGWLTFTNEADNDLNGQLYWVKQAQGAKYYSGGFTNQPEAVGSSYAPINGQVFTFGTGMACFTEGNLPVNFTNQISLANNKIISTNKLLKVTLVPGTGLFSGSVANPFGSKPKTLIFKGSVLQKQGAGYGFFLGTNQSGRVVIKSDK